MSNNISSILHEVGDELNTAKSKVSDFLNGGTSLPISSWKHGKDNKILTKTLIIAHRGASGYMPEHSLPGYQLAIDLGTDYIEPDLVLTKDLQFVSVHDLLLDQTTNIYQHPEFLERRTSKMVEGVNMTGFFVDDFSLDELQQLRVRQRLSDTRTKIYDNTFTIPTLPQIFQLAHNATIKYERQVGLYIELKHPLYYKDKGIAMDDMLLAALKEGGYETHGVVANLMGRTEPSPIVIQCFDPRTLVSLRSKCDLPLVQLVDTDPLNMPVSTIWTTANLDTVQEYANGIGPPLSFFTSSEISYAKGLEMMTQAAERNLVIHPWQLQAESKYTSARFNGNPVHESLYFVCCLEVQGIFTEFPDQTRLAIESSHNDAKICSVLCPSKFPNSTTMHKEWAKEIARDCAAPEKVGLLIAAVVILGVLVVILSAAACCTAEFVKTRRQLAELVEEGRQRRERGRVSREYEMVSVDDAESSLEKVGGGDKSQQQVVNALEMDDE